MRVGFNKNELNNVNSFYDVDDVDVIQDVAKDFAEQEHEIVESTDMNFTVYVEDDSGNIHEVKLYTEYDPRFEITSVSLIGR